MIDTLFGRHRVFSGVPVHMGHFSSKYNDRFGTAGCKYPMDNTTWRTIVQSGVAAWMGSWCSPMLKPCCGLESVGGDGTHVGIAIKTIVGLPKAWEPPDGVRPRFAGADSVMCNGLHVLVNRKGRVSDVQHQLRALTSVATHFQFGALKHAWDEFIRHGPDDLLHGWALDGIGRWAMLEFSDPEREAMRQVMHMLTSARKLLVFVTIDMAHEYKSAVANCESSTEVARVLQTQGCFRFQGMGSFLVTILQQQIVKHSQPQQCTVDLVNALVAAVTAIDDDMPSISLGDADITRDRPDPGATGVRYMMSDSGAYVRTRWPLPSGAELSGVNLETSIDGCRKKRIRMISDRARTQLWVSVCMRHHCVVGYHLMEHEGRRDCLLPLYAFLRAPPKTIFYDFACAASQTALQILPEYFCRTRFCHDCFHGYKHKCPYVFKVHTEEFNSTNTSVMEQFNAFLQTIRGVLRSGTTLLKTSMFWFDVFVAVWNSRRPVHDKSRSGFAASRHAEELRRVWESTQAS